MATWVPSQEVRDLISRYGRSIRGWPSLSLYDQTRFSIADKFWMLGITVSGQDVVFSPNIKGKSPMDQAAAIYHELTHVAQYRDYGWFGFVGTYLGQWFRSGLSYQKMKNKGLEKEAIREQNYFVNRCLTGA